MSVEERAIQQRVRARIRAEMDWCLLTTAEREQQKGSPRKGLTASLLHERLKRRVQSAHLPPYESFRHLLLPSCAYPLELWLIVAIAAALEVPISALFAEQLGRDDFVEYDELLDELRPSRYRSTDGWRDMVVVLNDVARRYRFEAADDTDPDAGGNLLRRVNTALARPVQGDS